MSKSDIESLQAPGDPHLIISRFRSSSLRWACILFITLLYYCPARGENDEFRQRLVDFHQQYETFVRDFMGCPPSVKPDSASTDGVTWITCEEKLGKMNQKAFRKAREAAKKLFELEEKK